MNRKTSGLLATLGFVASLTCLAYLIEKKRGKPVSQTSSPCPETEKQVDVTLTKLSKFFKTEKPSYKMDAENVCRIEDKQYVACITYPEPLHFSCNKVDPHIISHEFGHWLFHKRGGDYSNETLVEGFANVMAPQIEKMSLYPINMKLRLGGNMEKEIERELKAVGITEPERIEAGKEAYRKALAMLKENVTEGKEKGVSKKMICDYLARQDLEGYMRWMFTSILSPNYERLVGIRHAIAEVKTQETCV